MKCLERKIIPHARTHNTQSSRYVCLQMLVNQSPTTTSPQGSNWDSWDPSGIPTPSWQRQAGESAFKQAFAQRVSNTCSRTVEHKHGGPLTWNSHEHHPQLCARERILRAQLELAVLTQRGTAPAPATQSNWSCHVNKKWYKSELSSMANLKKKKH